VLAGLFVAFIFTIFPSQISEHKILRQKVEKSLRLLASYSNYVSATLNHRLRSPDENHTETMSRDSILKARRNSILFQELGLLSEMRQISVMVPWEVSVGGKFPKSSYDRLVDEVQR
jgi:hypothetical protein